MNTPITDAINMKRYVTHSEGYSALIETARRLELDRAALLEALDWLLGAYSEERPSILNTPIGSNALATLAAARENFPVP